MEERRMRAIRLIVLAAAAIGFGSVLADADEIAVSLVNPQGRIDIPATAITQVHTFANIAFRNTETGKVVEYPDPRVEVCFTEDIHQRVCALTRRIVEQPLAIVIDCATVMKPIVREPLCNRPCFDIATGDLDEATALAKRIRTGTNRACAPSSRTFVSPLHRLPRAAGG
jgi:hypothetical protein